MLYAHYLSINLKAALQYRLSSWLMALAQFLGAFLWYASIVMLFDRFGNISGWTFAEVGLCFAVTNISFALSECFARGFDTFSGMVIRGQFDRILLRPRSTVLQVMGSQFEMTRIGKLVQGFIVLAMVVPRFEAGWDAAKIITLILMISGGAALFTGVFILGATVCFFTLEGLEIINIFTDGGRTLAAYPLPVYGKWISRFFTFVIPYGCMNYLPLLYLTGRAGTVSVIYMLCPLFGFVFIIPCLFVWNMGLRRYASAGS